MPESSASDLCDDLKELDAFLVSEAVGEDAMLLTELDGFFAGLACSPELIMPAEWLPEIWGSDEPVFAEAREAERILGLVMGHYNTVQRDLDRGRYGPLYETDRDGSLFWELWVEGFGRAIALRPQAWSAFKEADDGDLQRAWIALLRLHALATEPSGELEPLGMDADLEEIAPDVLPWCIESLYRARLAMGETRPAPGDAQARRRGGKVGRNDPCPCGSGRKFKTCCGM